MACKRQAAGANPVAAFATTIRMKFATYRDGSRDGQLVVVARDLSSAHYASGVADRLQQALDDWNFIAPQLQDLYDSLNAGRARHAFPFDARQCMAPLPRAFQWVQADAYDGGLLPPEASPRDPGLHHGPGDGLAGACDPVPCLAEQTDVDFGAGLAVVTGDIAQGATAGQALEGVRLLMLVNAVQLRAAGLAPVQRWPQLACSPVAVTPDECGDAWDGGRLHLMLQTSWNGRRVGMADAAADMRWHFGELLAHLAATRALGAGSIVGGGTVRQRGVAQDGRPAWPKGCHSLADKHAIDVAMGHAGEAVYLRLGDSLRIEMKGRDGHSLFGQIEQDVVAQGRGAGA